MHRSIRPLAVTAALGLGAVLTVPPALAAAADVTHSASPVVSYAPALVPPTATARVHSVVTGSGKTVVHLTVKGLLPNRTYGAHAHVAGCAATVQGGGHFMHDPAAGVNAANEIWLDLTTNAAGNARATAVQDWPLTPGHRPVSVILHERATDAAGKAGSKLACLPAF